MPKPCSTPHRHNVLAIALAIACMPLFPESVAAAVPITKDTIIDGFSARDAYHVFGAKLTANGASTLEIDAEIGSHVELNNSTVTAAGGASGVTLSGAEATIQNSNISSARSQGIQARNSSHFTARDSTITGSLQGASLLGDSSATLQRTQLTGTAAGSSGMLIYDGSLNATDGSVVRGASNGVSFSHGRLVTPTSGRLVVDNAHIIGDSGAAILVGGDTGLKVSATVDIHNGSVLSGGNGTLVEVKATGNASVRVGSSALRGNVVVAVGGRADLTLEDTATLHGRLQNVERLDIAGGAAWSLSGNSDVGNLTLGQGFVALGDGLAFNTLNVTGNFIGNDGTIIFNTVLAGDDAATDKLIIGGDTSGSANVRVNNVGGAGAQTDKGIELIQVGGASNGQFNLAGRAVGGQYEYFLHKGTGADGNWYLRSQLPTQPDPCVIAPSLPECNPVDPEPVLRPEPGAYLANLQAAQTMFRLGYYDRNAGQNAGRAWARVDGSRNGFDAVSKQLDIRGNSQALTVGADLWRHESGSSAGVMLSTGNATSTSTNELTGYYARGKVKGEALGLYGTWRGGNGADPYSGFYVDGSLQRAQFRNRVEGIGLAAERYDSRAWQGAVETGYAFRVGGASNGGIYLEPQLQVGYSRWDSNRHTEANGTVVGAENANGMFGRAGLRLSGVTRWGNGSTEVQPYLAANWLHTRAESRIRMDDEIAAARIPRSRGEFSGGASLKFANGIGAWGGLSLQRASGYHQTSAQVGVSYSW